MGKNEGCTGSPYRISGVPMQSLGREKVGWGQEASSHKILDGEWGLT